MAGATTSNDVLSRVRREQRRHGKDSSFSGLRIILTATAITVAILLFAFGAVGMLLMARSPQEPIASRLDPSAPLVQQTETSAPALQPQAELPQTSEPQNNAELEKKAVKTLRVVTPASPPDAEPLQEKNESLAQSQPPASDPETTATIPPPQTQPQPQQVPQRAVQQRTVQQQHVQRRQVPNAQSDNPLFQLFGIKQYR